ncbi:MAG TPA: helix-turn-helix domain-containing protein [Streptosporangiaceae bacterium]|jgi:hypothetical protein
MQQGHLRHPRASLGRVLDHLGSTFLDIAVGTPDPSAEVGGVVIHDPLDEFPLPPGALVLGVGIQGSDEVAALLRQTGLHGGRGLVVRAPAPADEQVAAAVAETGVVLYALTRGASWSQLASLLRSLLAEDGVVSAEPETIGGVLAGDMFALANAVAAVLNAPVTFEDRNSRVLAFSGRQDEADRPRIETILGRQVPERFTRAMEEQGVFHALYSGSRPVSVDLKATGMPEVEVPRVAIAVRAGDEILGSIWVATTEPVSPKFEQALAESAKLVALHMLRARAGEDVERRLRADLVATALEGGPGASAAVARLGLSGRLAVVLAMGMPEPPAGSAASLARVETDRQHAADALALHMSVVHGGAAVALLGGVAYAIVPVLADRGCADERVAVVARDFLERTGSRVTGFIGVGSAAQDIAGLTHSRHQADRALRVLHAHGGVPRVARAADVHVESLLFELGDLAGHDVLAPAGPVAALISYDTEHGGMLVATLQAWLDSFGDVIAAAAAVSIHPNTFRYRLRRITEVSGLDLGDPDARFAAMLQLRLLDVVARSAHAAGNDGGFA